MRVFKYLFPLILLPLLGHAQVPMDFNKGFFLELEPLSPLQRFELTYEIYEAGFREDLGDLRIFNANNQVMPMHLRTISQTEMEKENKKKTTSFVLPVFPLEYSDRDGKQIHDYRLMVNTSENGTVVSVERTGENLPQKNNPLLIDATRSNEAMNGLSFELKVPMSSLLTLSIYGSDDLSSWQLVGVGTLARMEHENGQILKDTIPVYGKKWKYYRIQGEGDFSVVGEIKGIFGSPIFPKKETLWRWHTLQGKEVARGTYEYRIPNGLPASMLDLASDENAIIGLTVMVPAGENSWRAIGKNSFYRMNIDNRQIKNDPFFLPGAIKHFRVIIKGTPVPLRVGWNPQEIIFMPQDMPPFMLAVGNPAIPPENILGPMLGHMAGMKMGEATIGKTQILAGEKVLKTEDPKGIDIHKIILWCILGAGVLLLAGMAASLVRGMKKEE